MAVGPAIEMWSKQSATVESDDRNTRTVTVKRAFTVEIGATDRIEVAFRADGLPLVGSLYPNSYAIFCTKLNPTRLAPTLVQITAHYRGEIGPNDETGSPVLQPPSIRWSTSTTDEPIDEDWNGNPIVTANNEPIEGLTERLKDDVVTIERNFLFINRYALRQYRRSVNSDTFLGWPPGTARLMDDDSEAVYINGQIAYWRARATIQFREPFNTIPQRAWWKRVRHEGFLVRDTPDDDPHVAWDKKTKSPVTRPILLKEDGTVEDDPENAHFLEFQTLGYLPYSALGLVD